MADQNIALAYAMPAGFNTRLSRQQQVVIRVIAIEGKSLDSALELAGYGGNLNQVKNDLMHMPAFQHALHEAMRNKIRMDMLPQALAVEQRILSEQPDTIGGKELQARVAQRVIERSGFVAPKAEAANSSQQKAISDMTAEELREYVAEAQGRLADKAKPAVMEGQATPDGQASSFDTSNAIDAPETDDNDAQDIDIFD